MDWYYVVAFLLGGLVIGTIVGLSVFYVVGNMLLDILLRRRR